ncbi:hypothetical protein CEV32_1998 [Brucella rhizosphaerae]|uniref:Uncharacterized protein n=1 Tax=Brucella rhizosphaerae TaxID=571254 RepID=A0A256F3Z7_9HYPH|nr:hypothetical protein CEV32_1998 [Brucella rhizosphaerae]
MNVCMSKNSAAARGRSGACIFRWPKRIPKNAKRFLDKMRDEEKSVS